MARIAHNVCVSHVRRAVREKPAPLNDDLPDETADPEAAAHTALARARLLEAVRALPLPQRQVMTLHLEGFSNGEAAETLGLSEGNVAVRLTRGRAALKRSMGGGDDA